MRFRSAVKCLLILTLGSCSETADTPGSEAAPSWVGRTFVLQNATGYEPVPGTVVRISFRDGELGFGAGCNTYLAGYAVDGDVLVIPFEFGGTLLGCEPDLTPQEQWIQSFLRGQPRIALDGDWLTLTGVDAELELLDQVVAEPDLPLVGPTWVVMSISKGAAATGGFTSAMPTIAFDETGKFFVTTGCARGEGWFQLDGTAVVLSGVHYELGPCSDEFANIYDTHVRSMLDDGVVGFEVRSANLMLTRGEQGIQAQAQ